MCCHPDICSLEEKKEKEMKTNGWAHSLLKERACFLPSSSAATGPTHRLCGSHVRDRQESFLTSKPLTVLDRVIIPPVGALLLFVIF